MSSKFLGLLISLAAMGVYYGLTYLAFRLSFGKRFIVRNFTKKQIMIFSAILGILILFVAFIVSQNEYVYTWDSAGYWTWSYKHMNNIYTEPTLALGDLGESIIESDYNLIAPTIVSLPLKIFGYSFNRYVIVNFVMFVVPTIIMAVCLAKKLRDKWTGERKRLKNGVFWAVSVAVVIFFFVRLIPLFQGYIDVAILMPILLLLAFVIDWDATRKLRGRFWTLVVMGELLVMVFLLRRYAAFLVVGFMTALFIVSLIGVKRQNIGRVILNFAVMGGMALVTVLLFFHGLVFRILSENYADLYSAYSGSFGEKVVSLITRFGLVFIAVAVIGVIFALRAKKLRKITIVSLLTILITVVLFFRVQRMDGHHVLTITPAWFVLYSVGLCGLCELRARWGKVLRCAAVLLILAEPCYVYGRFVPERIVGVGNYVFGQKYYPLKRSDMDVLYNLRDYLNKTGSVDDVVYVLSSSVKFNWNTLSNLNKPYSEWAVDGQVMTHDVDLRDGFPGVFFDSTVLVVAEPIQLHLREGSQEVIRYLAEQVQDKDSYLGRHYREDEHIFEIEDGIKIHIYRKISDLTKGDYEKMFEYFNNRYPDHYTIFGERIRGYEESVL